MQPHNLTIDELIDRTTHQGPSPTEARLIERIEDLTGILTATRETLETLRDEIDDTRRSLDRVKDETIERVCSPDYDASEDSDEIIGVLQDKVAEQIDNLDSIADEIEKVREKMEP
jgi:methyl-accepting chemotaxis protein